MAKKRKQLDGPTWPWLLGGVILAGGIGVFAFGAWSVKKTSTPDNP